MITRDDGAGWSAVLAVQQAAHRSAHVLAARLAHLDLLPSEINVLANLAGGPAPTGSELAAAAGLPLTTLTSVLDRLGRRGLLTRSAHPEDRRSVLVELTAPGCDTAETVRQGLEDLERAALGSQPARVRDALRAGLTALSEVRP